MDALVAFALIILAILAVIVVAVMPHWLEMSIVVVLSLPYVAAWPLIRRIRVAKGIPEALFDQAIRDVRGQIKELCPPLKDIVARLSLAGTRASVHLVCKLDRDKSQLETAAPTVVEVVRRQMRARGMVEEPMLNLHLHVVSEEEIERFGGSFGYWREH